MFGLRKLEVAFRVELRDGNHVKAAGVLQQYVAGKIPIRVLEGAVGYAWLTFTTTERDERQMYHDVEVMKMLGIDITG
jgi:hypothetical protein